MLSSASHKADADVNSVGSKKSWTCDKIEDILHEELCDKISSVVVAGVWVTLCILKFNLFIDQSSGL